MSEQPVRRRSSASDHDARLAFVFPGQGSARPGMAAVWRHHPAGHVFDAVGAATGLDLRRLADDPDAVRRTAVAQPAVFAASLAAWTAVRDAGLTASVVAGHSLGEITAAVVAGALDLDDAAALVGERARAMQEAAEAAPGEMLAVLDLDDEDEARLVRLLPGDVTVADDNACGQVVLAGPTSALARAAITARALGGRVRRTTIEGPFHTATMTPVVVRVAAAVARCTVRDPAVPLLSGTTAAPLATAADVRRAITDGALASVHWRGVQERLVASGVDTIVELGPGGVLAGLARRCCPDLIALHVDRPSAAHALLDRLVAAESGAVQPVDEPIAAG